MKKNLSGSSTNFIDKIFIDLNPPSHCLEKLTSQSWDKKVQVIGGLSELNHANSLDLIKPFVNDRNQTLKEEAFIALVRLDPNKIALFFG